ncbi:MAG TPA: DUF4260 domain-containing protein [Gemmatimonadales bacterium]|nr:DUF4260 domain-containing protein [Gemmatimonadales bacterium]
MSGPARLAPGFVSGEPRLVLRLESLAVLAIAVLMYRQFGGGWGLFALCFLLPDLSMLGYLAGPRVGSALYNAAHSYVGPAILWLATRSLNSSWGIYAVLIWASHIAFDRLVGYGLKYPTQFGDTHLGAIGRRRAPGTETPAG